MGLDIVAAYRTSAEVEDLYGVRAIEITLLRVHRECVRRYAFEDELRRPARAGEMEMRASAPGMVTSTILVSLPMNQSIDTRW